MTGLAFQAPLPNAEHQEIVVGKDILELLTSGMYVDPLSLYREYVQNAGDAVDSAVAAGQLGAGEGRVEICIEPAQRTIRITDNGTGIRASQALRKLTSLGASEKRGSSARGFRGVGRLAGLSYCQELTFRTRSNEAEPVMEVRWDCRELKGRLRSLTDEDDLFSLMSRVVTSREIAGVDLPGRFFEVELKGVARLRSDALMSAAAVSEYLSEIGPVPFHPDFSLGAEFSSFLAQHGCATSVAVHVNGSVEPLFRPHRDRMVSEGKSVVFSKSEFLLIPGIDGNTAGVGWVLHHEYEGAISSRFSVRGLRLRTGNIQVGDSAVLEQLFPETRFNGWSVAEVHVLDPRIVPNGRRDHFEQNAHYLNLINQLGPLARDLSRRCRTSSTHRKLLRDFQLATEAAQTQLSILKQGALSDAGRASVESEVRKALAAATKVAEKEMIELERPAMQKQLGRLHAALNQCSGRGSSSPLSALPADQRAMYEHLFELVYECSANRTAAKALVDRILLKIN